MPNIASILKQEIARVSRKEVRADTERLKESAARYRSDIAALKRQVLALERTVARLVRSTRAKVESATDDEPGTAHRWSAEGLAKHRQRLGLSANQAAFLIGVSALSVYKWEGGKVRPRQSQLPAIAAFRRMGKKEVAAKLNEAAE